MSMKSGNTKTSSISDDEEMYDDIPGYYDHDMDDVDYSRKEDDPEYFDFEILKVTDVERLLNESVEAVCNVIKVAPALAKVLLHTHKWNIEDIIERHRMNDKKLLADSHILPLEPFQDNKLMRISMCNICMQRIYNSDNIIGLSCGHRFCTECWSAYFNVQIQSGLSTAIECMGRNCSILVPEDFVFSLLSNSNLRNKYQEFSFADHVKSHPELRFCPGLNCMMIARAKVSKSKRVICNSCLACFCFKCGLEYHAPTDCETIKRWLTKCADDSETANYISAHTKDCPKCHVCIEKNGGCNHMQCSKCKFDFCWMCLGDWKSHGSEYYECSRYKENPNIANESIHAQAREALKKYLFYFERV